VAGVSLWRRRPWGFLLGGAMLVLLLIESVSIAADQYTGHRLDPSQPVGTVALFVVLAAIGAVPTVAFLRAIGENAGTASANGVVSLGAEFKMGVLDADAADWADAGATATPDTQPSAHQPALTRTHSLLFGVRRIESIVARAPKA
jgi:hypothetical protein